MGPHSPVADAANGRGKIRFTKIALTGTEKLIICCSQNVLFFVKMTIIWPRTLSFWPDQSSFWSLGDDWLCAGIVIPRGVCLWVSSRGQGQLQQIIISPGQTDSRVYKQTWSNFLFQKPNTFLVTELLLCLPPLAPGPRPSPRPASRSPPSNEFICRP